MHRVKRLVKMTTASALYYLGVLHLWRRVALRKRAVVLMYHRVLTPEEDRASGSLPGMVVREASFERQMSFLKRHFVVLSMNEFADRLARREPFPDSSCVITFDDGWLDNYTRAMPILRRHGLPATVFLPVNFIGGQRMFWREALTHLLVRAVLEGRRDHAVRDRLRAVMAPHRLADLLDIHAADPGPLVREAVGAVHGLRAPAAAAIIEGLEAIVGPLETDTPDRFVDWRQVSEMAEHDIAFGGHGAEHRLLGELPPLEADVEIREAERVVGSKAAGAVPAFSYPNGSFTPTVVSLVRNAGYRLAFTTVPGAVEADDEPFTLRRVNIHEDSASSEPLFLARLVGLF